jgi:hypothetical protein
MQVGISQRYPKTKSKNDRPDMIFMVEYFLLLEMRVQMKN